MTTPDGSSSTSIGVSEHTTQQASTEDTSTHVSDDKEYTSQQTLSETTLSTSSDNAVSMTTTGHTDGKY